MKKRSQKDHKKHVVVIFGAIVEVFLVTCSGTVLEPKKGTPEWSRMWQNEAGCGQEAARMRKDLDPARSSPHSVQIPYRNLCRMSCRKGLETPLAAGLAAGVGGYKSSLGSLEALAVHPWFLYQEPLSRI